MVYFLLFLVSFGLTYAVKQVSLKKSIMDIPTDRSLHSVPTPRGGGIAVALTWFAGITFLWFTGGIDQKLYYASMSGIILCMVSYVDDIKNISPKVRMLTHMTVAAIGLFCLGGLERVDFGLFVLENRFISSVLAFVAIIWYINLYNFLDGIDGYAGSEALFLASAGFVLFGGSHFPVLGAAVLGFLVWNWHKARIFMGDVGSTLLGYNIAVFTIYYQNNGHSFLIWVIIFSVFWFDAVITLFRRLLNREKLSQAHKKHAYQRLIQAGMRHDRVVVLAMLLNLILFCLVYFIDSIFAAFSFSVVLLTAAMYYIDKRMPFKYK